MHSAQTQALDLVESLDYSGIVSSHGWSNDTIYPRIYELGGVVTPYAGGSDGLRARVAQHTRQWADDRFYFGFGYGSDTNGFGSQGGPRGADAENPVNIPFTGFGGVTVQQQQSGTRSPTTSTSTASRTTVSTRTGSRTFDARPATRSSRTWQRGPEAYLQMWERAIGIAPDSCRSDVADLASTAEKKLKKNMTYEDVLRTLGQPSSRSATAFTYCVAGGRTLRVEFKQDGRVAGWRTTR